MKCYISPWALLFYALWFYFDDTGTLAAAVPAICVHELGHVLALRAFRAPVTHIKLTLTGLELRHAGQLGRGQMLAVVLAGPAAGLLYAFIMPWGKSAKLSLALSVFNLLPVWPLDGGRALRLCMRRRPVAIERCVSWGLLAVSLYLAFGYGALSPLLVSLWLVLLTF